MKSVRQAGFISLTALSILVGSSFVLITSLQAGPLSRCQQSLARFASSSIVKKIKEMRAQLMIQISKNQDEAFSELKDQTLKPKPWLYAKTALETSTIFWASVYGLSGLRSLGIEGFGGNAEGAQISSAIIAHPVCMMVVLAGFAPLTEECLFRYLPRALLGKSWNVGVAASLVFEFAHNIHQIPLPQISDGFYFWYLMKSRGLPYSIAAHSILGAWVVFSTLYL